MKLYSMDLHIHTVLSPCAELEMGAPDIIEKCKSEKIDIIAITDHNSARNAGAVQNAAAGSGVTVICGLEVQSSEDIHVLCLFPDHGHALRFGQWVWNLLPPIPNRPEKFGEQVVVDEFNQIIEELEPLLLQGIGATADEIAKVTRLYGGVSILAHIDRPSYSYIAVLGLIPEGLEVDAVELSGGLSAQEALAWLEPAAGRKVIRCSDAHRLEDIKYEKTTPVYLENPSFEEIWLALKGIRGREILWPWNA